MTNASRKRLPARLALLDDPLIPTRAMLVKMRQESYTDPGFGGQPPAHNAPDASVASLMAGVDAMVRDVTEISLVITKFERIVTDVACRATLSRLALACHEFVSRLQSSRPSGC